MDDDDDDDELLMKFPYPLACSNVCPFHQKQEGGKLYDAVKVRRCLRRIDSML
jgi:hypothetical protein